MNAYVLISPKYVRTYALTRFFPNPKIRVMGGPSYAIFGQSMPFFIVLGSLRGRNAVSQYRTVGNGVKGEVGSIAPFPRLWPAEILANSSLSKTQGLLILCLEIGFYLGIKM